MDCEPGDSGADSEAAAARRVEAELAAALDAIHVFWYTAVDIYSTWEDLLPGPERDAAWKQFREAMQAMTSAARTATAALEMYRLRLPGQGHRPPAQ